MGETILMADVLDWVEESLVHTIKSNSKNSAFNQILEYLRIVNVQRSYGGLLNFSFSDSHC